METSDVLVVGAGPTGLLLAGDLAEAGVSVTVLERRPTAQANLTRAFAVHARTLEELDARGLADDLVATGQRVTELAFLGQVRLDLSSLPSRFPFVLVTPQYHTEAGLLRRAEAAGARIERGVGAVGLRQDVTGVRVDVRDASGAPGTRRAGYLVGTDGAHSTVRTALGEPFPGRSVVRSVMLADVRLDAAPASPFIAQAGAAGFTLLASFGDGWHRVVAWDRADQQPDDVPVRVDEVRDLMRRLLGTDYGMREVRWTSRFHSDERQVAHYRVGRVFLAGDAAHVHSPAGGQGLNTGLQDAANLGWRLAGAVRGWAPPSVLEGYHAERHPVGRMVLWGSDLLLRGITAAEPVRRILRGLAVRRLPGSGRSTRWVLGAVSGVAVRYRAPAGAPRQVGRRVPDLPLTGAGPARLYEALRGGRFVLVGSSAGAAGAVGAVGDAAAVAARRGWRGPVAAVVSATPLAADLLVRPDGYLAWASTQR